NLLKLETLKFIKHELQHPDADARAPYAPPDDRRVLEMLTGEIVGETLREDGSSLVSATIVRVQPRFAIARLDSGLDGFISVANVTDYRIEAVSDELAPGQAVVAVVKRIDFEKMSLDLSMRQSDIDEALRRTTASMPDPSLVDKYFDFDTEAALRERAKALKQKSSARMRTIPHPLFKPLNSREAEQYLASRPRGDCVIRPSSRGTDHIAITWKVAEGLFQHIDVQERDKPNDAALGSTFLVGDSAYTDLDELVAFHVDPIARKLEEVKRNPKFYDPETDPLYSAQPVATVLGVNDYSDEYKSRRQDLWESRTARHLDTLAQSTGRGSYCISLSLLKPGSLVLAFKPTPTYAGIMKWTARVEPNEFKLGEKGRYPDINGLINGFKRMQTSSTSSSSSHKPASGAYEESRSSTSGRSHHQHRSYGDTGSSSRWGESRDNRSSRSTNAWGEQQPSSSSQRQSGAAAASSSSRWDS
ncbi:Transcription elongation factor spt6, partial [Coemansia sp. RSA 2424]